VKKKHESSFQSLAVSEQALALLYALKKENESCYLVPEEIP